MTHDPSTSILDLPPIRLELDVRQAFGLAYALTSYLMRLGGPRGGLQTELASIALRIRERLPEQCRELIGVPARVPHPEGC